jgi:hypothetical protein
MKSFAAALLALFCIASTVRAAESAATFEVGGLKFTRPATWKSVEPTSSMRKAQLIAPGKDGKGDGEVLFFHFGPGNGGGTQANVDRWLGQFSEPKDKIGAKTEEKTIGKTKVVFVQAEGTYKSGMPGGPQTPLADQGLRGAIIEAEGGSIFIRMTAPKLMATFHEKDFRAMVEGALK